MIDRYAPMHQGTQPSRVLQFNITRQFENTTPDFIARTRLAMQLNGLNPGIKYHLSQKAITEKIEGHIQTPYVDGAKAIHFHETFASYVWIIAYSLIVLYDEAVAKPAQNVFFAEERNVIDHARIRKTEDLFKYGISLIMLFDVWDKSALPNPEYYDEADEFYVERINAVYVYAVNFILCHEFVHVERGHVDQAVAAKPSNEESLGFEKEADGEAIEYILQGVPADRRRTAIAGILVGLCCMLYFRASAKGTTHPDVNKRIDTFLTRVSPAGDDPIWGIAALAYRLWDTQFGKGFNYPKEVVDFKEMYEHVKKQVERENGSPEE